MKKNNKGFTLAELLIVVAIIAVLVAVAIPVFTTQLEKSREATDQANVRSAYADVMARYMTNPASSYTMSVTAHQGKSSWEAGNQGQITIMINGKESLRNYSAVTNPGKYIVSINKAGEVSINPQPASSGGSTGGGEG